jgi:hypothetical protein
MSLTEYSLKHCAMQVCECAVHVESCLAPQGAGESDDDLAYRRAMLGEKKQALAAWLARLKARAVRVRLWLESLDERGHGGPDGSEDWDDDFSRPKEGS